MKPNIIIPSMLTMPDGLTTNKAGRLLREAGYINERTRKYNEQLGTPWASARHIHVLPGTMMPETVPPAEVQVRYIEGLMLARQAGMDLRQVTTQMDLESQTGGVDHDALGVALEALQTVEERLHWVIRESLKEARMEVYAVLQARLSKD